MINRDMIYQTIAFYREVEAKLGTEKCRGMTSLIQRESELDKRPHGGSAADYLEKLTELIDEPEDNTTNHEEGEVVHE